jgi:predicted nucleic acid-binding protein
VIVVDASVWVSVFVEQDVNHRISWQWVRRQVAARETLAEPYLLLPEVVGSVARRSGRPRVAYRAVEDLLASPGLHLLPLERGLARIATVLAAELRLPGADAVYVAVARVLGVPLVTWDREQRERAAPVVTTMVPT